MMDPLPFSPAWEQAMWILAMAAGALLLLVVGLIAEHRHRQPASPKPERQEGEPVDAMVIRIRRNFRLLKVCQGRCHWPYETLTECEHCHTELCEDCLRFSHSLADCDAALERQRKAREAAMAIRGMA